MAKSKDIIPSDPNAGPTCVYQKGESKIVLGLDVAAAYADGWFKVPTDHPLSTEKPNKGK